ncbi:phospholipase D-like domain-containing protein [Ramlibacter sp. H39-3-26]|uniref:phospholipase D-like domain-containing protein n=1 Tax=Curvibacter soli TaxID=3031331 RepID=UPI0023DC0FC1|nr:phospholipase D-like domain-containing protein [Ramlibacter sp. H39-3-26]MDF1484298.1 phospholipase D-like domain-containing protein [Ramlibacter sp. H39-3-26]
MLHALLAWTPSVTQHLLFSAIAVLVYVLTTRARREQRAPATAIAWVMGLALVPYLVLPMYLAFGQRKLRPRRAGPVPPPPAPAARHWACALIESFGLAPAGLCSDMHFHADGAQAAQALWDTIARARERIDVCTFIIGRDAFGRAVVERLAERARAGVQVRVLLDGFGALLVPRGHFDTLRASGGSVTVFRPLFTLRPTGPRNLRNHRKFVIADSVWLWCGGRNLASQYFLGKPGQAPWLDLSFDLRGPVATAAAYQFELDWCDTRRIPPCPAPVPASAAAPRTPPDTLAQLLPSGPDQVEDTAHALLIDACFRARQRIVVATPYFIPSNPLRDALRLAARRGVEITVVMPQRSNHRLADFVRTRAMRDLAAHGVRFVLLPTMCHAKAVVVDAQMALCGSINLDLRSLLINHEASVVFYSAREIEWLARWTLDAAHAGQPYEAHPPGLLRDVAEGLLLTVAFQL